MDHWIALAARKQPERIAIDGPERTLTYTELAAAAAVGAAKLQELAGPGADRVALALAPGEALVIALHACALAGLAAVPIDLRLGPEEQARRHAGVGPVISEPLGETGQLGVSESSGLALDSVLAVMHTSGTTAAPKPVMLTNGNFLASALGSAVALGLDPAERWLCPMPLSHVGGLSIPIRSAVYATTVILHGRFDTGAVLEELMDPGRRITLVSLVPTMLARLLDAGLERPPTLRWALLGGGPIAPALLARAHAAAVPVAPSYGMTEACSQIATFGWPLPGADLRIEQDGEILARGPIVAPGAYAADGWLHTGDLGSFASDGRLRVHGRKVDTIISGGENVAPSEVEAALLEHPRVADAAVFGRADPEWGEAVVARVVLEDGARVAAQELREHCAARIARFKVPKVIEYACELPRTQSGKLMRRELR